MRVIRCTFCQGCSDARLHSCGNEQLLFQRIRRITIVGIRKDQAHVISARRRETMLKYIRYSSTRYHLAGIVAKGPDKAVIAEGLRRRRRRTMIIELIVQIGTGPDLGIVE